MHHLERDLRFDAAVRNIIMIPAHVLERDLQRALSLYRPAVGLRGFHVVMFVNGSQADFGPRAFADRCRNLAFLARRTLKTSGGLQFSMMSHRFAKREPMGRIRAMMVDAVILRCLRLGIRDPRVIFNEADQLWLPAGYLQELGRMFDSNLALDLVAGKICFGYGPEGRPWFPGGERIPELFLLTRFIDAWQDECLERYPWRFLTPGENLAVRLSAYCLVGGPDRSMHAGEDIDLGLRLMAARVPRRRFVAHQSHHAFSRKAFCVTDPRRMLWSLMKDAAVRRREGLGSRLDVERLAAAYRTCPSLLQTEDLIRAREGSQEAQEKIKTRLEHIFLRTLPAHCYQRPRILRASLERCGLAVRRLTVPNIPEGRALDVDIRRSAILSGMADG